MNEVAILAAADELAAATKEAIVRTAANPCTHLELGRCVAMMLNTCAVAVPLSDSTAVICQPKESAPVASDVEHVVCLTGSRDCEGLPSIRRRARPASTHPRPRFASKKSPRRSPVSIYRLQQKRLGTLGGSSRVVTPGGRNRGQPASGRFFAVRRKLSAHDRQSGSTDTARVDPYPG
jgi:hypothetical protein